MFHYNIRWTNEYKKIKQILNDIKSIIQGQKKSKDKNKLIRKKIISIQKLYVNLKYYTEIYVYAHHIFNSIREDIIKNPKITGGGITLEEFKELIRQKIKLI